MIEQPEQKYSEKLKQSFANDITIYDRYVGKQVIMEEGNVDNQISRGVLVTHGSQFADFIDYAQLDETIKWIGERVADCKEDSNYPNPNRVKPRFTLPRRTIAKSQIASIQLLEDVLQGVKPENIFETGNSQ